jgi:lipoprotein-releasing system permease protein
LNLSYYIGKRYLFSKKTRNAINIISWISILSVTVSAAALIIVLSAMNGITHTIKSLYQSMGADIVISPKSGKYFNPDTILQVLKTEKDIQYINPIIQDQLLIKTESKQCVATIKGVSKDFEHFTDLDSMLMDGVFRLDSGAVSTIMIGRGVAMRLGIGAVDPFQTLDLYAPSSSISNVINPADAFNTLKVRPEGIFMVNDELDFKFIIAPISVCRELFIKQDKVTDIELVLKNENNSKRIIQKLEQSFGSNFTFKNRFQQNETLYRTMETEKLWTFIILAFIALIAIITIIGAVTMLMVEKRKDLKIYDFLGAEVLQLKKVFHFTGFYIVAIGSLVGIGIGVLVVLLQQHFKIIGMQEGFVVDAFPVKLETWDLVFSFLFLLLCGWLISRIPVYFFFKNQHKFNSS